VTAAFAVGTLVRARGRDWVVLSGSDGDLLRLRPLGGRDEESTGLLTALEEVAPSIFELPSSGDLGDERSARLLRDALRLGLRSTAGPFRCFGSLAFDPRAYQLVPLLMALRLDPVRILVADDVGTGKTASALLIAAELLATGDASRLAVLCPPHLALQWQAEMEDKFHLPVELVLPATASRLERGCRIDETLFQRHDITVVSTDFIKSDRRREEFLRTAPELVIVDEAHTVAMATGANRARHQRHELVAGLASDPARHLVLVTATPHSGKEEAFRSLLGLLDPAFADLPDDLSGDKNQAVRRRLARHFVQRRRADLRRFLDDTPFPDRLTREETWTLSDAYRSLFDRALAFASEIVANPDGGTRERRVRWWSALGLMRALASSPAAAASTLRERAKTADASSVEEVDDRGRQLVLDLVDEEDTEGFDEGLGVDLEEAAEMSPTRRRLLEMAKAADACKGRGDPKLARLAEIVEELVGEGWHPIVFCRYIATADYVAGELRSRLPGIEIVAVTGAVPASERPSRVAELTTADKRILVATDCLSEGINLQENFDAVVHYDLSWNPTRYEQREGRVDRLGQPRDQVRVVTLYGADNRIDRLVLDVLVRKHETIRASTGVSVPIPGDSGEIIAALAEGLFATDGDRGGEQLAFEGLGPRQMGMLAEWDVAAERETRSRTVFAQEAIKVDEVVREVNEARHAVGSRQEVARFVADAVRALGGAVVGTEKLRISLNQLPTAARDAVGGMAEVQMGTSGLARSGEATLTRSDPFVSGLAAYLLDSALDSLGESPARRCGVVRSAAVATLTTLLLVRYRFDLTYQKGRQSGQLLVEDADVLGFSGLPDSPVWLKSEEVGTLLDVSASSNISPEQARDYAETALEAVGSWREHLDDVAQRRAAELLESHRRVRAGIGQETKSWQVTPYLPPDILGVYLYVPAPRS
jgi:superfamily II DNA or RNA helicase